MMHDSKSTFARKRYDGNLRLSIAASEIRSRACLRGSRSSDDLRQLALPPGIEPFQMFPSFQKFQVFQSFKEPVLSPIEGFHRFTPFKSSD
jgi:hypothetical protein